MAKLHETTNSAKIVVTVEIASEPKPMTGKELLARAKRLSEVWLDFTDEQKDKWLDKAMQIEYAAYVVSLATTIDWDEPWQNDKPPQEVQLELGLNDKTCKAKR